eukprot:13212933-Alexandrium_andersonii.AAC.1
MPAPMSSRLQGCYGRSAARARSLSGGAQPLASALRCTVVVRAAGAARSAREGAEPPAARWPDELPPAEGSTSEPEVRCLAS